MAFEIEDSVLLKYIPEDEETAVVIPEGVTAIGDAAFERCECLQSVMIPTSVTSIGGWAFYGCKSLTSVTIPEGVASIGNYAFCFCTSLTGVTIPAGTTSIGRGAFSKTPWLEYDPDDLVIINGILLTYKGTDAHVTIPEGVTSIGECAFYECKILASAAIPESVTKISGYAFYECESLQSVHIPESVTEIDDHAFDTCRSIRMFGITFAPKAFRGKDYTNARKMLKTRDFSMKISTDIKYAAAVGFWMKTGDETAESFIRKSLSRIMPFLIETGNTDAIGKMLESGKFIIKKNIDKFIVCAIKNARNGGSLEIQTMLLHYKAEVLGYGDPADAFKL